MGPNCRIINSFLNEWLNSCLRLEQNSTHCNNQWTCGMSPKSITASLPAYVLLGWNGKRQWARVTVYPLIDTAILRVRSILGTLVWEYVPFNKVGLLSQRGSACSEGCHMKTKIAICTLPQLLLPWIILSTITVVIQLPPPSSSLCTSLDQNGASVAHVAQGGWLKEPICPFHLSHSSYTLIEVSN